MSKLPRDRRAPLRRVAGGLGRGGRGLDRSGRRATGRRHRFAAKTLDVDAAWLADAELVIVRRTQEGSVERELIVSDFSFGTAARTVTTDR